MSTHTPLQRFPDPPLASTQTPSPLPELPKGFLELPLLHAAVAMATTQPLMKKSDRFIFPSLDWPGGRVCHEAMFRVR